MSAGPDAGERDGEAGKRWRQAPDLRCALPGRPFSPKDLLNKATSNVIASLIFGCRFEYNDPRFLKMLNLVEDSLDEVAQFMREVGEGDEEPLLSELVKAGHLPAMGLARGFIWRVVGERAFQARDATAKRRKGLEVCVGGGEIAGNRGGRARPGSVLQERAEEPVLPLWEPQNTRERWSLGSSFWQPWPREGRGQHLGRNQVSGGNAPKAAGTWTGQEEHLGARTTVRAPRLWPAQVLNAIPVLLHIPGLAAKVFPAQNALIALLKELAAEHRTAWDPARPPQDLTEAFLDKMEEVRGSCWGRGLGL